MIRAVGGRCIVRVRRDDTTGNGMRAYLARELGAWTWVVPAPKGHPRTPALASLRGRERTMDEAVASGLRRLSEIYGGPGD